MIILTTNQLKPEYNIWDKLIQCIGQQSNSLNKRTKDDNLKQAKMNDQTALKHKQHE